MALPPFKSPPRSWLLGRAAPPPPGSRADPAGFSNVRLIAGEADSGPIRYFDDLPVRALAGADDSLKVLALSAGGAGGAFGAGALVGLSKAGARPTFDVVTGVSTGALLAPFAFVGSDWDARLGAAYAQGGVARVLGLRSYRPGLRLSLYSGESLSLLVRQYVDEELLDGVRQAHAQGRRLLIATANLDTGSTSIWDMGAIASHGGEAALGLFVDVLAASASLPGVFPPKMIAVQTPDGAFEEMHVDGGAIMPLFVAPEDLLVRRATPWSRSRVEIFALVNTTLETAFRSTSMYAAPILIRSFELMLRSSYRNALRSVAAFCEINDFDLLTASIPEEFGAASMLRFEADFMATLFARGEEMGEGAALWSRFRGAAPPA